MIDRLRQSLQGFLSLFRRARLDQEHDAEVAAHLDLAIDENRKNGMSDEEARRQARTSWVARRLPATLPFFPSNAIYDRSTSIFPRSMSFASSIVLS